MKRLSLQPAYVLHRRAYRETSFLVELLTRDYGRFTALGRGMRKSHAASSGLLQPFIPLLISCSGKGDLMVLSQVEMHGRMTRLQGDCLFAGFYLNELLMHLLQKWDAHAELYATYEKTIIALYTAGLEQKTLRSFEKQLLEALGYGPLPQSHRLLHNTFLPEAYYQFTPEKGFHIMTQERANAVPRESAGFNTFSGKNLLAIAKEDWEAESVLQDARRLIRLILDPLLGTKTIHSRHLFLMRKNT